MLMQAEMCIHVRERNLGSLRLKKKADINLFSSKPLGAVSQEAVFGASLLLRAEKRDFLCELCTSKTLPAEYLRLMQTPTVKFG